MIFAGLCNPVQCIPTELFKGGYGIAFHDQDLILQLYFFLATITGTRSLIFFENQYAAGLFVHAVVRQQWGGELDGVGLTLATFLKHAVIDYGFKEREDTEIACGGFADLVARYITKIKEDKPGHPFYVAPNVPGLEEEYNYHVKNTIRGVFVQVNDSENMSVDEFLKICKTQRNTGIMNL